MTLRKLLALEGQAYAPFDRYVVDGYLGEGSTAKVLLATDTRLGREVAVKLRLGQEDATPDESMRFHREAKALAQVEHPNVVRVIDYSGPECKTPFLIIERVKGVDLLSLVTGRPLDELETCAVGYMLAAAIAAMHEKGIIHRDIKPENAMLSEEGRVVLIDFGFCKGLLSEEAAPGDTFIDKPTKCVGTPAFASPEQLRGLRLTPASDIFSLGSTLYFLSTEVLPFPGETLRDSMVAIMKSPPFPLTQLIDCSPEYEALITSLLDKDIGKRAALVGEAKNTLFRLGARAGKPFEDVCRAIAKARGSKPRDLKPVEGEGGDFTRMKRMLMGSGEPPLEEVTHWNARHAPPKDRTEITKQTEVHDKTAVTAVSADKTTVATTPGERSEETTLRGGEKLQTAIKKLRREKGPARWPYYLAAALVLSFVLTWAGVRLLRPRPVTTIAETPPVAPVPLPPPVTGALRVAVKPWGKVTIDGVERGVTPELRVVVLSAGPHAVIVDNPRYGRIERVVDVSAEEGETLAVFDFTR